MKKLLSVVTTVVTLSAAGPFAMGFASADDGSDGASPDGTSRLGTPGRAYAMGGAHVLGIPYDEYIRRTGAGWFPGLDRQIVHYPAGQVQGHVLGRLIPGVGKLDKQFPGAGFDGPSIGESVDVGQGNLLSAIHQGGQGTAIGLSEGAMVLTVVQDELANDPTAPPPNELSFATYGNPLGVNPFSKSFLRQNFPVGSVVPALDFRMPQPVDSQYDTYQFVSAYDSIADFPDRPDNLMALLNAVVGLATGHTAVAFTNPSMVPPRNIVTTVNSRGAKTTTYMVPEQHLPLVQPFKYLGMSEADMRHLDSVMQPMIDAGYSRDDNPVTAPVEVDPVHGYDPAAVTAPATEAAFGGGSDPASQLMAGLNYVLSHGPSPN